MSSYNTTTISNIFARLYSTLRRVYAQYAGNFNARQYLVFATVILKRPDRIPYYTTVDGARSKVSPAGYLPTDISPYYLKERPVYFYDQLAFMQWRIGNNNTYSLSANPPYIVLNLFLNGAYRDVFINYDNSKMDVELYALDALLFVDQGTRITALQKVLEDTIMQLTICYNQLKLLDQARAQGKYSNTAFISKWQGRVDGWITSLQNDARFVVKVCKECNNNASLGTTIAPITYITMAGAVSLTWMLKSFATYDQAKFYLDELFIEVERLRIDLDTQWKAVQGYTGPVDSGVAPMPTVTVTAPKPKTAGNNWWWALLVVGGLGFVVSGDNKKSK